LKWSKRTETTIWLTKSSLDVSKERDGISVILTPAYYSVKKDALPVKYRRQAVKLAPSLFDGLLDETQSYRYVVYPEGNGWTAIAFSEHEVIDALKKRGIELSAVRHICFAQQFAESIEKKPLLLNEKEGLMVVNGIVTLVPSAVISEEASRDMSRLTMKGKCTVLRGESISSIPPRYAIRIAAVFLFFAVIWLVEGVRYRFAEKEISRRLETLYETYPSLRSRYTLESIARKYRSIDQKERKKREIVEKMASAAGKTAKLTAFEMKKELFRARFETDDDAKARMLRRRLSRAGFSVKADGKTGIVAEGHL